MNKIIRLNITFSSAQYLPHSLSPECNKLHGHNYQVDVYLRTNKIVNFKYIKQIVKNFDHVVLAPESQKDFWNVIQNARHDYIRKHGGENELPRFVVVYLPVRELTVEEIGKFLRKEIETIHGVISADLELWETDECSTIIDEDVERC